MLLKSICVRSNLDLLWHLVIFSASATWTFDTLEVGWIRLFSWGWMVINHPQIKWLVRRGFTSWWMCKRRKNKWSWRPKLKKRMPCKVKHLDDIYIWTIKDHEILKTQLNFNFMKTRALECGSDGFVCQQHCGHIHFRLKQSYDFVRACTQLPIRAFVLFWFLNQNLLT